MIWGNELTYHKDRGLQIPIEKISSIPRSAAAEIIIPSKNGEFGILKKAYVDFTTEWFALNTVTENGYKYSNIFNLGHDAGSWSDENGMNNEDWGKIKNELGLNNEVMLTAVLLENGEYSFYGDLDGKEPYSDQERDSLNKSAVMWGKPTGKVFVVSNKADLEKILQSTQNIDGEILIQSALTIKP